MGADAPFQVPTHLGSSTPPGEGKATRTGLPSQPAAPFPKAQSSFPHRTQMLRASRFLPYNRGRFRRRHRLCTLHRVEGGPCGAAGRPIKNRRILLFALPLGGVPSRGWGTWGFVPSSSRDAFLFHPFLNVVAQRLRVVAHVRAGGIPPISKKATSSRGRRRQRLHPLYAPFTRPESVEEYIAQPNLYAVEVSSIQAGGCPKR